MEPNIEQMHLFGFSGSESDRFVRRYAWLYLPSGRHWTLRRFSLALIITGIFGKIVISSINWLGLGNSTIACVVGAIAVTTICFYSCYRLSYPPIPLDDPYPLLVDQG